MNIPTKFGSHWSSGSREDEKQTTHFLAPLGLLFLLCTTNKKKYITIYRVQSNEYSFQVWF